MIEVSCGCAGVRKVPESAVGRPLKCPKCGQIIRLTTGETLPEGAGAGDFDVVLTVVAGPELVGVRYLLGGVSDIQIGKLEDRQIRLQGNLVSREHGRLSRLDFGPSRWKIIDNHSTNGLRVNGVGVAEQELHEGDRIAVGEYELEFSCVSQPQVLAVNEKAAAANAPGSAPHALGGGPVCPSCEKSLPRSAKLCIDCGINIATGRPVLTSQGVDENFLYEYANQWIRWVSLLVWVTPLPIPIRSEAFGTRKPYAIWTIAAATVLASITFFIAQNMGGGFYGNRPGSELMLWPPGGHHLKVASLRPEKIHAIAVKMTAQEREQLRREFDDPDGRLSDDELVSRAVSLVAAEMAAAGGEFHWYQLITHAFLHDTSSIYNFVMHLAGNLLFLLVFGSRVNALIGNIATACLYPILAIGAATVHLLSMGDGPSGPMLGASGAIMGLAGMYLVLFPAHHVYCAMWISIWLRFRRLYGCKIFRMRGFWILLIYFGYDILMNAISSHFGHGGGVAHWAHIGGFLTGATLGLGVLFSRMFNTHGGDVLSVTLGRNAWPLIGRPSRWNSVSQGTEYIPAAKGAIYA
jgi:membrane associated rhomboid family serine protease/pSer/pThr/pTyr-binding forkhead associated (FHA) protein